MRWDNLFDDIEGQLEHELDADDVELRAERERLRLARLSLRERLTSLAAGEGDDRHHSAPEGDGRRQPNALTLQLTSGATIRVRPATFGRDWFSGELLEEARRPRHCVVPLAAIAGILVSTADAARSLADEPARGRAPSLSDRIGIAFVLRDLCRRRAGVELQTAAGSFHGTIDRVAREHLDLAVHEPGSPRRAASVTQVRIVPIEQITLVRV
ncbi:hypothetical protein OSC27_02235 [Microbacterium sp. STN6]|uniref:hypothetical protein n=1 Tax=Microbacterium sp. STN6 TaxID=2995588 RepID=UPI002260B2B4|nr:hypothetical protein [Microbacterium sp. STN6]MCX7521092.1 hypothetical protein [Microbacterium sp. STN6]